VSRNDSAGAVVRQAPRTSTTSPTDAASVMIFGFEEIPYFRLEVVLEGGEPVKLVGHYDNGHTDENLRD